MPHWAPAMSNSRLSASIAFLAVMVELVTVASPRFPIEGSQASGHDVLRWQALSPASLWMTHGMSPQSCGIRRLAGGTDPLPATAESRGVRRKPIKSADSGKSVSQRPRLVAIGSKSGAKKRTVVIRCTEVVYAAAGASAFFFGGMSELVSASLSVIDLKSVALVDIREEGGLYYATTITIEQSLHRALKKAAQNRDCSMNVLINSAITEYLRPLIASNLPLQILRRVTEINSRRLPGRSLPLKPPRQSG